MEGSVKREDPAAEAVLPPQPAQNAPVDATPAPTTRKRGSANSDPPAKRARQTRRHDDWWLPDGSVVLELHGVQFRLYRAHLARKSPFFEKLFSEPSSETVDGCPLYVLERGTPDEFAALLNALDESLSNDYISEKPSFKSIIPILRMATLYNFPRAREWAITIAKYYWSPALDDDIRGSRKDIVDAILNVKECRVYDLGKAAWYRLLGKFQEIDIKQLPAEDLRRLLGAQHRCLTRWTDEVSRPPTMACPAKPTPTFVVTFCSNGLTVQAQSHAWRQIVHDSSIFKWGLTRPIGALATLIELKWGKHGYCEQCADAM